MGEDFKSDAHLAGRKKYMLFFDRCPAHSKIEDRFDLLPSVFPKRLERHSPELKVVELRFSCYKAVIKKKLKIIDPVEQHRQRNATLRQCRTDIPFQTYECSSAIPQC